MKKEKQSKKFAGFKTRQSKKVCLSSAIDSGRRMALLKKISVKRIVYIRLNLPAIYAATQQRSGKQKEEKGSRQEFFVEIGLQAIQLEKNAEILLAGGFAGFQKFAVECLALQFCLRPYR